MNEQTDEPGTRKFGLSKSKITHFEICPKRLWLSVHKKDEADQLAKSQMRFDAGNEAGQLACALLPNGVMVSDPTDLSLALAETSQLLEGGHRAPIFEGTFSHDGVLVQVDILEPAENGAWHVAEVKSASSVKDYHIGDLATQTWVLKQTGVQIASTCIRHINRDFVLTELGNYEGLFVDSPLEEELAPIIDRRPETVRLARETLSGAEPDVAMGSQCQSPFECKFQTYCSRNVPPGPKWPISLLPRTGAKIASEWAKKGAFDLHDLESEDLKAENHRIVHAATVSGRTYLNREGVAAAIKDWSWPRHFLDFETVALTVPRWLGTRPNQSIPFQFSCHTQSEDGSISHAEYLHTESSDPRRGCALKLIDALRDGGEHNSPIIAYHASVERKAIRELANRCPDLAPELEALEKRVVDLLPVVRDNYYHRDQRGSWSIKYVLPTLGLGIGYSDLEVADGMAAQESWIKMVRPETSEADAEAIRRQLLEYCQMDTFAMVKLLEHLTVSCSGVGK